MLFVDPQSVLLETFRIEFQCNDTCLIFFKVTEQSWGISSDFTSVMRGHIDPNIDYAMSCSLKHSVPRFQLQDSCFIFIICCYYKYILFLLFRFAVTWMT